MIADLVFLLDVDNTLLDNEAVMDDFRRHLTETLGLELERRYWDIFERLWNELGYADHLAALQQYRMGRPGDPHALAASLFLLRYPFAERLYPRALEVIAGARGDVPKLQLFGDSTAKEYGDPVEGVGAR